MAHKKKQHQEVHGEGWIVSFADLMCLMMSFFVIMSAGNPKDVKMDPEFAEIVAAIKQAFHYLPPSDSTDPVDVQILLNQLKSQKGRGGAGKRGDAHDHSEGAVGKYDQVSTVRMGSQITMGGYIRFARGSSDLRPESVRVLQQIAEKVRGHTNIFVIKGHTSRDEEHELADSGRDLAYERAVRVVEQLVQLGLSREALRVQSCRAYEPVKEAAYSDEEIAVNRRVEIIATESLIHEFRGDAPKLEAYWADPPLRLAPEALDAGEPAPAGPRQAEPPSSHADESERPANGGAVVLGVAPAEAAGGHH